MDNERKIDLMPGDNIESAVYTLLAAKARGQHVYCVFNGNVLHSDNVTMDSAYKEVLGCTKEEYNKLMEEWLKEREQAKKESEARDQGYVEKVQASRTEDKKAITLEEVVNGLKFIAANRTMSQEELIEGLLKLGCNFTLDDIKQQFPEDNEIFEGLKQGKIGCGASVIVNSRDSEYGRSYCDDRFLSFDNDTSIYNFIRVTTGDESYTKEMVDSLNEVSEKCR